MLTGFTPTSLVLQGDTGGERVLQKKWTTFLKAQLLCSLPDDGFPFNIIQDMFVLTPSPEDWKNTVFYGVFTSQWWAPNSLVFLINASPNKCNTFRCVNWKCDSVWRISYKCSERNQSAGRAMATFEDTKVPYKVWGMLAGLIFFFINRTLQRTIAKTSFIFG